jgi:hypothetical protein
MTLRNRQSLRAADPREEGQTLADYSLLLGLVTLVAIVAFAAFGQWTLNLLESVRRVIVP